MRPIVMTTLAAILTLLPLALAIGQGSSMQQPLAVAIISGLVVQLPLVLLVMPSIFLLLHRPALNWARAAQRLNCRDKASRAHPRIGEVYGAAAERDADRPGQ